jgi:hypothetical protein
VLFHRGLSCLVAFELKVRELCPEDLGKLSSPGIPIASRSRCTSRARQHPAVVTSRRSSI